MALITRKGGNGSTTSPNMTYQEADLPVSVLGQSSFTLPIVPPNPASTMLIINGNVAEYGVDYSITGTNLQWISTDYILADTDKIRFLY